MFFWGQKKGEEGRRVWRREPREGAQRKYEKKLRKNWTGRKEKADTKERREPEPLDLSTRKSFENNFSDQQGTLKKSTKSSLPWSPYPLPFLAEILPSISTSEKIENK